MYTYEISIKTYWNNCKTSSKKSGSFERISWRGKVLMEYFSDTNVCSVCSQIQSISEQWNIQDRKNAFWCLTLNNALRMGKFSITCDAFALGRSINVELASEQTLVQMKFFLRAVLSSVSSCRRLLKKIC